MAKFLEAAYNGDVDTLDQLYEGPRSQEYTTANTSFQFPSTTSSAGREGQQDPPQIQGEASNRTLSSPSSSSGKGSKQQQQSKEVDTKNAVHIAANRGNTLAVRWMLQNEFDVHRKTKKGATAFLLACYGGHQETAEELLRHGASPDDADYLGRNALHLASLGGHVSLSKWLVETCSFSVEAQSRNHMQPLHFAALAGHLPIVKWLVEEKGCSVEVVSSEGLSPALFAGAQGNLEVLQYLLSRGNNPRLCDKMGRTLLHLASANGRTDVVFSLLQNYGLDPHQKDSKGNSPLELTEESLKLESIRSNAGKRRTFKQIHQHLRNAASPPSTPVLLEAGESEDGVVRVKWKIPQRTPCVPPIESYQVQSSKEWSLAASKEIVVSNKDVSVLNEAGKEQPEDGDDTGDVTMYTDIPLPKGLFTFRIRAQNKNGYGSYSNKISEVQVGQSSPTKPKKDAQSTPDRPQGVPVNGASPEVVPPRPAQTLPSLPRVDVTDEGYKELFNAAAAGRIQELSNLFKRGVNLAVAKADDGRTPLHVAAKKGHVRAVRWLVNASVPLQAVDDYGATAFLLSVVSGRTLVAIELHKHGANLDDADRNGYNALAYAIIKEQYHLFRWLLEAGASSTTRKGHFVDIFEIIRKHAKQEWHCTLNAMIEASRDIPPTPPPPVPVDSSRFSIFAAAPRIPSSEYPAGTTPVEEVEFQYCRKISLNPFWETVEEKNICFE
eukprot:gb/GECG01002186.1/.p1 GENE.gb/GECG01002186.1/~~gb/GECG01002186.1/.p1  ORF type:complete len:721 (+),score=81.99 gb/GECG01002186.1/:1-2163(+)